MATPIRARTGPRTRPLGVAAASLAAAIGLAACGGSGDGAVSPAVPATPSASAPAPSRTGLTRDPAAPIPSTAFHAGVAEAWTVPGTAMSDTGGSVSADRSMIGMWAQAAGGTLQVFEVGPTASDPLWEGRCDTAHWWANRLVCGGDVVDPLNGDTVPLPTGTYAGGNAETLVVRDDDTWVAHDADLTETWRADAEGDGMVYGFPDLPIAMAVDMTTFASHTVDLRTGEVTATALTALAADGYLEATDAAGPLVAHDLTGAVVGERPLDAPECIPPYGERQVLADRLSCADRYAGDADLSDVPGFLLRADGSPKLLEFAPTGFAVDGESFEAGDRGFIMAWMFGDENHFLVRFDAGFGLYAAGSPDPVWEVDANDLLVASPELLVAHRAGGVVAVLTP